jgi:predicted ribosome quality control (RQC) complex YloA/Tae2 family protein
LYRLKGAAGKVVLLDGSIQELPEGLRAEEAAQRWFTAVKRAERGLGRVAELEAERIRQLGELEQIPTEGAEVKKESTEKKQKTQFVKGKKGMEQDHKRQDGKGRAFRSVMVDNFEVLIGKGDADNDALTFKVGNPCDFWLHVASVPGSHVLIRNPDKVSEPPREVIERAAQLAAFFSKAREGGKVEVHYCRVADVSKPRGFAPGKVLLKTYKSVRVYPKE